jgi:o-succinylbenzoate---CoA ligase
VGMLVEAWLARAATSAPATLALQTPAGSCSYAELLARARAGAAELAARGARRGDRVAIALPAELDFACALHACLLLGAAAVPVDLRLGDAERRAVCDGASVVVDEPLRADPSRSGASSARTRSAVRARPSAGAVGSGAGSAAGSGAGHDLDAVAAVIHTSGTTSAPRPVELTYANFLWSALGSAVALGRDPRERWLCALPLAHVGGLSILLRSAIYATTAVVHPRFDTELVLRALREEQVTLVSLVATTLTRLLDAGLRSPAALRCALTGGGPVPAALIARASTAGVPVSLTYGLTEACSQVTTTPVTALGCASAPSSPQHPTAGPPLFCTAVRIADDDEILIQGPTVAPAATASGGWLHTGDIGRLNTQGYLEVTGRKADTIVSGGENVAPAEVEAALEEHPAVLEAAVLPRPDERWGEAVAALVVVRPGREVGERELREHCAARLAPYKVPKHLALIAGPLPRTRSGKLLRRELR